eukprot:3038303-Rhodomonas_salina.2
MPADRVARVGNGVGRGGGMGVPLERPVVIVVEGLHHLLRKSPVSSHSKCALNSRHTMTWSSASLPPLIPISERNSRSMETSTDDTDGCSRRAPLNISHALRR